MKKVLTITCILLTLFVFVSCKNDLVGEVIPPEANLAPEVENPTPEVDGPYYSGTDVSNSPFIGKFESSYNALFASSSDFVFVNTIVQEDGTTTTEPIQKPSIECRKDGTFSLIIAKAIGEGYVTINGTFTVDGEMAEFTISQANYGDFMGSKTEKFTCKLIHKNDLRYWGDQIGVVSGGEIFSKMT